MENWFCYFSIIWGPHCAQLAATVRVSKIYRMLSCIAICQTPMMPFIRCPMPPGCILPCFFVSARSVRSRLFALGVVVLYLVEFARPNRLSHVSTVLGHRNQCATYLTLLVADVLLEVLGVWALARAVVPSFVCGRRAYKLDVSKLRSIYFQGFKSGELIIPVPRWVPPAGVCVGWPPPAEKRSSMFWTPCVLYGLGNQYWRMKR